MKSDIENPYGRVYFVVPEEHLLLIEDWDVTSVGQTPCREIDPNKRIFELDDFLGTDQHTS